MSRRLAVIGAGLAGLTLAHRMARQADVSVRVFEKARGPGGRMSTRRRDDLAFDHGAQYFTCRDVRFQAQVADWLDRAVVAPWHGRVVAIDQGLTKPDPGGDVRYVGTPRMSAIGRDLAEGLDLELSRRVTGLRSEASGGSPGWWLQVEGGDEAGPFDAVVIATPAPQAVPLLSDAMPAWAEAVSRIDMQPCHAAMVAFEERVEAPFDGAFVHGGPLAWVARNHAKPARGQASTWVLHTTPAWSAAHLDMPAEESAPILIEAFAEIAGAPLPPLIHADVHRWLYARSEHPLGEPHLWDPARSIGVCGDWAIGGRVEGAYLSGLGLSDAMTHAWGSSAA